MEAVYALVFLYFFSFCILFDLSVSIWTGLPEVDFVLPDSYVDPEHQDYGGENLRIS